MSEVGTFMDLAVDGQVMADEIDHYVEVWHDSNSDCEVFEFLGMTFEEYSLWVMNPELINVVIASRVRKVDLLEAVNDNVTNTERLAARAGEARDVTRLREWIANQPDR
jgi:hypothetical protein